MAYELADGQTAEISDDGTALRAEGLNNGSGRQKTNIVLVPKEECFVFFNCLVCPETRQRRKSRPCRSGRGNGALTGSAVDWWFLASEIHAAPEPARAVQRKLGRGVQRGKAPLVAAIVCRRGNPTAGRVARRLPSGAPRRARQAGWRMRAGRATAAWSRRENTGCCARITGTAVGVDFLD